MSASLSYEVGMSSRKRLPGSFYRRETLEVTRDLLGRVLCRRLSGGEVLRGRIVEVEAYGGAEDRASHACRGPTPRNASMFGPGGIAYVYRIYGVHFCLNVVTGERGRPGAVLLRATEPAVAGESATGPGRLCRAFRIDRAFDGRSLLGRELWLEEGSPVADREVRRTPRIGVDGAGAPARRRAYRFVIRGHARASGPRRLR
jgi:DNA-3-methyladenine glycosylase